MTLPRYFDASYDKEKADVNFIHAQQDYAFVEGDYQTARRLVSHPRVTEKLSSKSFQCTLARSAHEVIDPEFASKHGGWAPCWTLPENEKEVAWFENWLKDR